MIAAIIEGFRLDMRLFYQARRRKAKLSDKLQLVVVAKYDKLKLIGFGGPI